MEADLAQLDSGLMPEAMDKYYGLRYAVPATLLDHLTGPIFVLDEVGGIRDAQKATEFRRGEELTGLLEEGVICPGLDVLYQTMDDLAIAAQKQSTLLCENFLRGMNEFKLKDLINAEAFRGPQLGRRPGLPAGRSGPSGGSRAMPSRCSQAPPRALPPSPGTWPTKATRSA